MATGCRVGRVQVSFSSSIVTCTYNPASRQVIKYQVASTRSQDYFESNMLVCSQDFLRSADPECSAFKLSISRHPSQSFPSGKGGLGHERLNPEEYPRHPWIKKCGLYMGSYEIYDFSCYLLLFFALRL